MDGFKNTTKTSYDTASGRKFANGGMTVSRNDMAGGQGPMSKPAMVAKYAKGGHVTKGEKKIGRVMTEFTEGKLHSGSKEGPKVKSTKQAVAIALNEARAAGAKIPRAQKARGGMMDESTSARPVKVGMTDDEKAMNRTLSRAERIQGLEAREEQKLMREARDSRKVGPKTTEMVKERRMAAQRDVREPMIRNPLMDRLTQLPSQRGEFPVRRATGGLSVMPRGKKGC